VVRMPSVLPWKLQVTVSTMLRSPRALSPRLSSSFYKASAAPRSLPTCNTSLFAMLTMTLSGSLVGTLTLLVEDEDIMLKEERDNLVAMLLMLIDDARSKEAAGRGPTSIDCLFELAGRSESEGFLVPMLDAGLDPFLTMKNRTTLLHKAVDNTFVLGESLVDRLLTAGVPASSADHDGWTVLHQAVSIHRGPNAAVQLVRTLVQHGALVSAKGKDGWSVLHAAVGQGDEPIVRLLLNLGASARGPLPPTTTHPSCTKPARRATGTPLTRSSSSTSTTHHPKQRARQCSCMPSSVAILTRYTSYSPTTLMSRGLTDAARRRWDGQHGTLTRPSST